MERKLKIKMGCGKEDGGREDLECENLEKKEGGRGRAGG